MRIIRTFILLASAFSLLVSCNSGYQKENGKWVWVSYDEAVGKRVSEIDEHDYQSFEILNDKNYAIDKNSVFHIRSKIKFADPESFILIDKGYSKDKNRVFLDDEMVIFANPNFFELLEFPYSKDNAHIFCGTLPLQLDQSEVNEFKVTNTDELMSSMKSSTVLSHFIEFNPEYKWLDTLGIDGVIVGEWATGETEDKKFKGINELKE